VRSLAEHGIDQLVHETFFEDSSPGVFVEVGAAGPEFLSIGALFRRLGWRVIAIEPNPTFCAAHRAAGHEVLEFACCDRDENDVSFDVVDMHGALYEGGPVTFESFSALRVKDAYRALRESSLDVRQIRVNVRRLDTLLVEYAPDVRQVEIVSIDVEGWELEVLAGFSLERYRPRVLIVENLLDDPGYRRVLKERGYRRWRRIGPNELYLPRGAVPSASR
jgi:FkbM family methyltransferase